MKKGYLFLLIFLLICFISCKTVDLEPFAEAERAIETKVDQEQEKQRINEQLQVEQINAAVDLEKQVVYIEKPIVLPPLEKVPEKLAGEAASEQAVKNFVNPVLHTGSALIAPYSENEIYRIATQVLQMTNIYLEPGEQMIGEPAISDKPRFVLGAGVSRVNGVERQHLYIKPTEAGLTASLIINTTKRVYNLVLYSYTDIYTPIVRWTYIDEGLPKLFAGTQGKNVELDNMLENIDPRFLSMDYKMSFNVFSKPDWTPKLVYDDGKKTYIVMPEVVLQRELPGCFEKNNEILNYRISGNLFIIDKLIETITLKYKTQKIKIWKK